MSNSRKYYGGVRERLDALANNGKFSATQRIYLKIETLSDGALDGRL